MSKFEENPNLDIPIEGEISMETKETDKLSLKEIETEVNRRNKAKALDNKPKKKSNLIDPLDIDPNDRPPVELEAIDPRFEGKTETELIKMYMNLESLHKKHTDEVGSLRKENTELKDKKDKVLNLQRLNKWTPEKRQAWFKLFNTEPEKALQQVNLEALEETRALDNVTSEEVRLKELHKNSIVPYVDSEINVLISTNQDWWKKYGTGIFEHAYNVFRNKPEIYDKYAAIRSNNIVTKEQTAEPEADSDNSQFVEGRRPTKVVTQSKEITLQQLKNADPDTSMDAIRRELKKRGVKIELPQGY